MITRIGLFAVIAAAGLAVAALPATPGLADSTTTTTKTTTTKKAVHKKHHVVRKTSPAYPALEPYRSSGFKGEFPGSCAYDRAAGNCMIDLGYGRCVPCSIGDGGRF